MKFGCILAYNLSSICFNCLDYSLYCQSKHPLSQSKSGQETSASCWKVKVNPGKKLQHHVEKLLRCSSQSHLSVRSRHSYRTDCKFRWPQVRRQHCDNPSKAILKKIRTECTKRAEWGEGHWHQTLKIALCNPAASPFFQLQDVTTSFWPRLLQRDVFHTNWNPGAEVK